MTTYYKFLSKGGQATHGKHSTPFYWNLPTKNEETGEWTPGEWMPPVRGALARCQNGYHATTLENLTKWALEELYEVEFKKPPQEDLLQPDKVFGKQARLLRHIETWNERTMVAWACDCAEHTLKIFEDKYPDDKRPRLAIETARSWLRGEVPAYAAYAAACAAAGAADAADAAADAAEKEWQNKRLLDYLEGRIEATPTSSERR